MMVRHHCGPQYTVFGFQFIPWTSRIREYGHSASLLGRKQFLHMGVIPKSRGPEVAEVIGKMFEKEVKVLPFLAVTLTPSNQIIHPARYYGIFHDWARVRCYGVY